MRVIIESEEKATVPAVQTQPSASEAINAGPPAPSLSDSGNLTTRLPDENNFRDGINAGGPPASLLQALQEAGAPSRSVMSVDEDAGAAPKQ